MHKVGPLTPEMLLWALLKAQRTLPASNSVFTWN